MVTKTRLGPDFGKLWGAATATNLGDGISVVAGPLLVSQLTGDPALVGAAVFAQQLPWLLFSLVSGAYADRLDRRKLIIAVNLFRAAVIGGLAVSVWTGHVTIPIIYLAFFLIGTGETLADNATSALVPGVVRVEDLPRANARITAVFFVGNQFVAPPIGAALFVFAAAVPFGVNAVTFVVAAVLVALLRYRPGVPDAGERKPLLAEIGEGLRYLWGHRLLRVLAVCLCVMNVTFMGAFAIMVLYVRQHLGLSEVGYGVFVGAGAVGGLVGTVVVGRLQERFGPGALLRAGLVVETVTHLVLAATDSAIVAGAMMVVFSVHAAVWGVVAMSTRQRIVPDRLRGRVSSVYYLLVVGGAAIGALVSGFVARTFGITAPFWAAGVLNVVVSALAWRSFRRGAFEAA